jgi:hypothetical protein
MIVAVTRGATSLKSLPCAPKSGLAGTEAFRVFCSKVDGLADSGPPAARLMATDGHVVVQVKDVTSDAVGLAIGPMAETANNVQEALNRARQMFETGLANVSIEDEAGHKIEGDELVDCITGKKKITADLQAV